MNRSTDTQGICFKRVLLVVSGADSDAVAFADVLRLLRPHDPQEPAPGNATPAESPASAPATDATMDHPAEAAELHPPVLAELEVLLIGPSLPRRFAQHKQAYEQGLRDRVQATFDSAMRGCAADVSSGSRPTLRVEADLGPMPADRVVRRVLTGGHDLVIKHADPIEAGRGCRGVDMRLLRACPCPVWLSRAGHDQQNSSGNLKIAVAVDPRSDEPAGDALSNRLLQTAAALARTHGAGELTAVSCWDYEFETFLRTNPWHVVAGDDLHEAVQTERREHRAALQRLLVDAGVKRQGLTLHVQHLRGRPELEIPAAADRAGIDLLVLGTVARTGVPGFVMGNTAEDVLRRIGCALLAVKPPGFQSPITR